MKTHLLLGLALVAALTVAAPSQTTYGSGSPGTGSFVPTLSCGQPWLGNPTFSLDVDFGLGGAVAWVGVSTVPATIPLGGSTIHIGLNPTELLILEPVVLSGPVGAAGAGSASFFIPLALPPDPTLAGLEFSCQALVDESPGVFSTTAGLTVRLVMPPVIFVGTSVGGSADPTYFIDPITQSMRAPFTSNADNVTDAEFAHDGRRLYVGLSLGNSVQEVNLDTPIPTWSTFFAASGSCYGISVDHQRDIVYTLAGQSPGNELVAIDAALGSPTYGQVIGTTTGLGATNGFVERWELSPDGRTAAVLTVFSPQLILVDTDPSSPTYLQFNNLGPIPAGTSPFPLATTVIFTADSAQILVAISLGQAGEIGRYDLAFGQWLDHDPGTPGIQQIGPSSAPPATVPAGTWDLDLSPNGLFAVVAGFGGAGGAGRLQLDPTNALNWGYTPLATGIPGAWACAVSGDNQSVAVGSFGGPSPQLVVLDALTGATQFTVPLPGASNVYTVKWH